MTWRLWKRGARQEQQAPLPRRRTHSRPRVASAAEAARTVKAEMGAGTSAGLGSAGLGMSYAIAVQPVAARAAQPVRGIGAFAPVSPTALLAAARASNRTVEEVWEETLLAWIGGSGEAIPAARPAPQAVERRARVWHEIDSTLGSLRAC